MEHNAYISVGRATKRKRDGVSSEYKIAHFKYEAYSTEELVPELRDLRVTFTGTVKDGTWTGLPLGGPGWRPPIWTDFKRPNFDDVVWSEEFVKEVDKRKKSGDTTVDGLWDVIHIGAFYVL